MLQAGPPPPSPPPRVRETPDAGREGQPVGERDGVLSWRSWRQTRRRIVVTQINNVNLRHKYSHTVFQFRSFEDDHKKGRITVIKEETDNKI